MKIGLIDADMYWRKKAKQRRYGKSKADVYPNLAIMKISAYHKAKGDDVEWYNGLFEYDIVYVSKVFSDTPDSKERINTKLLILGGTGYQIKLVDGHEVFVEHPFFEMGNVPVQFSPRLSDEVEHMMPDYGLYHMVKDTAQGFLSRGCPRGCGFCHVKPKEGGKSYKVADLSEWWGGAKKYNITRPQHPRLPRLERFNATAY